MSFSTKQISQNSNSTGNQSQNRTSLNGDELFSKIQQIRDSFTLSKLSKNKTLEIVAQELIQTEKLAPIEENKDYVLISIYSILDSFSNENNDQIINRWLSDCSKRQVVISPGNYGAVKIQFDDETKSSGKIALIVALIYRPK